MNIIEDEWKDYENSVIPTEAGAIQRRETRFAFYAGINAMIAILVSSGSEEEEFERFKSIHESLKVFDKELQNSFQMSSKSSMM